MVLYSDLKNWENGNISDIDRAGLISIARYFEAHAEDKDPKDEIEYDRQRDEDYTGVPDDTPTATDEQTEESSHNSTMAQMVTLAREYGLDEVNFAQFWQMRFSDQGTMYMRDWARRLRDGTAREQADHETMRALHKCGLLE